MIGPGARAGDFPAGHRYLMLGLPSPETLQWQVALSRFSPNHLYSAVGVGGAVAVDPLA